MAVNQPINHSHRDVDNIEQEYNSQPKEVNLIKYQQIRTEQEEWEQGNDDRFLNTKNNPFNNFIDVDSLN